MLRVTYLRLDREAVPRLRAWLDGLDARKAELAESYRRQRTRQELFHLIEGSDGPVLAIVTESSDVGAGAKEFLDSQLPIDLEFKALIQEAGFAEPSATLLFDSVELLPDPPSDVPQEDER